MFMSACDTRVQSNAFTSEVINLREYYVPIHELNKPRVYCYADSTGKLARYHKFQLILNDSGIDTSLLMVHYDEDFRESSRQTDKISPEGFTYGSLLIRPKEQDGVTLETKYTIAYMPWLHPQKEDSLTYHLQAVLRNGEGQVTMQQKGYFEKNNIVSVESPYAVEDCIKQTEFITAETSIEFVNSQLYEMNYIIYLAKNVGPIYYTEPSLDGTEKKYSLKKIIPVEEFEKMMVTQ